MQCFSIQKAVALPHTKRTDANRIPSNARKMFLHRTLCILVLIVLHVGQISGHSNSVQELVDEQLWHKKELKVRENAPSRKNNHDGETEQDSEKMMSGEGDFVAVVAELRREVRALKSEMRGVQAGLSECAAARVDARRAENDHVRVQWMQREMAETRQGRNGIIWSRRHGEFLKFRQIHC